MVNTVNKLCGVQVLVLALQMAMIKCYSSNYFPIHSRLYFYGLSALFCINLFTLFTSYSQQIRMFFGRQLANFDSIKAALLLYGNVNETPSWYKFLQRRKTFVTIQLAISIYKKTSKKQKNFIFKRTFLLFWTHLISLIFPYPFIIISLIIEASGVETKIEVASNSIVTQD